jgi:hypothetical protein
MSKKVIIAIVVIILAVIAFLIYRYRAAKKKAEANKKPLITNITASPTGAKLVSDLENGLEPDVVKSNGLPTNPDRSTQGDFLRDYISPSETRGFTVE